MAISSSSHAISSCSWVGRLFLSQHSLLTASFTSMETLRERKPLFSHSSSKSLRIYFAWPDLDPCTCPSCPDHLGCSPLFCISQTYLPFKSCSSSIASVSSLFLFFLYGFFVKFFSLLEKIIFFPALDVIQLPPGCILFTSSRPESLTGQFHFLPFSLLLCT